MLPRKFCKISAILNFSLQGFTLTFANDEYVSCSCSRHMFPPIPAARKWHTLSLILRHNWQEIPDSKKNRLGQVIDTGNPI
jgi:hypothetical protein